MTFIRPLLKKKGNKLKQTLLMIKAQCTNYDANFIDGDDAPLTHLNVSDFFEDPSGNNDHLIGNGNVKHYDYYVIFMFKHIPI